MFSEMRSMSLNEQLTSDMKQAMKDKDKLTLSVIRMVKASIKNEEINLGHDLTDDEVLTVLLKEVKQRKDAIQGFEEADRKDLIEQHEDEIRVLQKYLPQPLTTDELTNIIKDIISSENAESMKDMGRVMNLTLEKVKGRADGKEVSQIVKSLLS